jgi:hypothetical protein
LQSLNDELGGWDVEDAVLHLVETSEENQIEEKKHGESSNVLLDTKKSPKTFAAPQDKSPEDSGLDSKIALVDTPEKQSPDNKETKSLDEDPDQSFFESFLSFLRAEQLKSQKKKTGHSKFAAMVGTIFMEKFPCATENTSEDKVRAYYEELCDQALQSCQILLGQEHFDLDLLKAGCEHGN